MRVGLDARTLASSVRSGVEHYVINLVEAFSKLENAPAIIAYVDKPIPDPEIARLASSGTIRTVVVEAKRGWLRLALPWRMRRDRVDVAHFPSTILPFLAPRPAVVTVHDLAWKHHPEAYSPDDLRMQTVAILSAVRAKQIITVSETTARELVEEGRFRRDAVTTVPLGVSPRFSPAGPRLAPDAFSGADRLQDGYLLYVGRLVPRKNLPRLLEAYRHLLERRFAPPLVLTGAGDDYAVRLQQWARELGLQDRVLFTGQVPDSLLPPLYRSATVFVYPSLYEGFGLPVLEAMASGTPVVTSDVGGTAEVAGDAAVLADPERVEALADAMELLLRDRLLWASCVKRGLARAKHYTWERTARETLAVYERAAR